MLGHRDSTNTAKGTLSTRSAIRDVSTPEIGADHVTVGRSPGRRLPRGLATNSNASVGVHRGAGTSMVSVVHSPAAQIGA